MLTHECFEKYQQGKKWKLTRIEWKKFPQTLCIPSVAGVTGVGFRLVT